jgi:hypothetical protein
MSGARRSARRKAVKLIRWRFGGTRCTWQRAVLLNQQSLAKSIVKLPPLRPPLPLHSNCSDATSTYSCHAELPLCSNTRRYSLLSNPVQLLQLPDTPPHLANRTAPRCVLLFGHPRHQTYTRLPRIHLHIHTLTFVLAAGLEVVRFQVRLHEVFARASLWADLITTAELIHIAYMIIHILNNIHILTNTLHAS